MHSIQAPWLGLYGISMGDFLVIDLYHDLRVISCDTIGRMSII